MLRPNPCFSRRQKPPSAWSSSKAEQGVYCNQGVKRKRRQGQRTKAVACACKRTRCQRKGRASAPRRRGSRVQLHPPPKRRQGQRTKAARPEHANASTAKEKAGPTGGACAWRVQTHDPPKGRGESKVAREKKNKEEENNQQQQKKSRVLTKSAFQGSGKWNPLLYDQKGPNPK